LKNNILYIPSDELANKVLPLIEEYGFLDKDEVYEEI
tara:strand:- start:327 stop:437 length:111 start_codon:yes stop_codon:yes gene_type:complete